MLGSEWQHKPKPHGRWHALLPSITAFRELRGRKWYGAELGMRICITMIWLEGMLPSQFSPPAERTAAGWPFHGERGCLEVVCRKKRLNETEKDETGCQALPVGCIPIRSTTLLTRNLFPWGLMSIPAIRKICTSLYYAGQQELYSVKIAYDQVYPSSPPWSHSPQPCLLHSHTPSNHSRGPRPQH
jgi:hypothetical protein